MILLTIEDFFFKKFVTEYHFVLQSIINAKK